MKTRDRDQETKNKRQRKKAVKQPTFIDDDINIYEVVIGDLGKDWSFNKLNQAFLILMQQPTPNFYALELTRYSLTDGVLQLDVAPFMAALEYATGLHAQVMGKPEKSFFYTAMEILGSSAKQTIMIGDDILSDIDESQCAGIKGILVKTGKILAGDMDQGIQPHVVLNSINDLPEWWKQSDFNIDGPIYSLKEDLNRQCIIN